jgi:hypothetical protein
LATTALAASALAQQGLGEPGLLRQALFITSSRKQQGLANGKPLLFLLTFKLPKPLA